MKTVDFKSTTGIIQELEDTINGVKCEQSDLKKADLTLRGCKHAIQVFALSLEYAQFKNSTSPQLPEVRLEGPELK